MTDQINHAIELAGPAAAMADVSTLMGTLSERMVNCALTGTAEEEFAMSHVIFKVASRDPLKGDVWGNLIEMISFARALHDVARAYDLTGRTDAGAPCFDTAQGLIAKTLETVAQIIEMTAATQEMN